MKMPQIVLLIAPWLLHRNSSEAQTLHHTYTPIHILGGAFSERVCGPFGMAENPAVAPFIEGVAVAAVAEKKYDTDLHSLIISGALGWNHNALTMSLQHFGNSDYSERTLTVGVGKGLGKINIGTSVKYSSVTINGIAATHFVQGVVASLIKLTENVTGSVVLTNPNFFILKSTQAVRPASGFSLGFGWQASPLFYTGVEYIKREHQPLNILLNLQYHFGTDLLAMLSWTTANNQPYLNIAWTYSAIKLAAGCSYHASLGISPTISMTYQKRKDAK